MVQQVSENVSPPEFSASGLREGRVPNSVTLSFLPLTHQTIAVCVYSSRDHRSKIYLFYTDACYAPNRAKCATPVLYARPGLSPAALAYHAPPPLYLFCIYIIKVVVYVCIVYYA
jgi:hypothetical protein